jgi:hypothetical protein
VDLIFALVLLGLAATPLALLSAWLATRGSRPLGSLINGGDNQTWWRSTMPWPVGVQEEDGLTWSFPDSRQTTATAPRSKRDVADEIRIEPTRVRPLVRRR